MPHPTFRKRAWLALLLLLPIPLLAESTGLDIRLENYYFDPALHTFPWRNVFWFNVMVHDGLRTLLVFVATGVLGLLLMSLFAPRYLENYIAPQWYRPRVLVYLLLAMLAGPGVVGLLKQVTTHPCPWSLDMYGGFAHYHTLFGGPFFNLSSPGKCWPGAHASGGFGLLAFVPLLSGRKRWWMLAAALGLGLAMGWSRMMQGAHFLSHNLWAAWFCWAAVLLVYELVKPHQAGSPAVAPEEITR